MGSFLDIVYKYSTYPSPDVNEEINLILVVSILCIREYSRIILYYIMHTLE